MMMLATVTTLLLGAHAAPVPPSNATGTPWPWHREGTVRVVVGGVSRQFLSG